MKHCTKCNCKLSETQHYCENCGQKYSQEESVAPIIKTVTVAKKTAYIMVGFALIVFFLVAGIALTHPSLRFAHQLSRGQKFLSQNDYVQAEQAYLKAIGVNDKATEPYMALMDVYTALENQEKLKQILEMGFANTQDPLLKPLEDVKTILPSENAPILPPPSESTESSSDEQETIKTVDEQTKQKISKYLSENMSSTMRFPKPFSSPEMFDVAWALDTKNFYGDPTIYDKFKACAECKYSNVLELSDIESYVQRDIHPQIVLSKDKNYSDVVDGEVSHDHYAWNGKGGASGSYKAYVLDVTMDKTTYQVKVLELFQQAPHEYYNYMDEMTKQLDYTLLAYNPQTNNWDMPVGVVSKFANETGYEVGREEYNFNVDVNTLPFSIYQLEGNGKGSYYIYSKADSAAIIQEKKPENKLVEVFKKHYTENILESYQVAADFDKDGAQEMFIFVAKEQGANPSLWRGDVWYVKEDKILPIYNYQQGFQCDFPPDLMPIPEEFYKDSLFTLKMDDKYFLGISTVSPHNNYIQILDVLTGTPRIQLSYEGEPPQIVNGIMRYTTADIPGIKKIRSEGAFDPPGAGYAMPQYFTLHNGTLVPLAGKKISEKELEGKNGAEGLLTVSDIYIEGGDFLGFVPQSFKRDSIILRGNEIVEVNYSCIDADGRKGYFYTATSLTRTDSWDTKMYCGITYVS